MSQTLFQIWYRIDRQTLVHCVLLSVFMDLCITLYCQPAAYWGGNYSLVLEGNPVAAFVLGVHPILFVLMITMLYLPGSYILNFLPRQWAADICLFLIVAHLYCVAGWFYLSPSFV